MKDTLERTREPNLDLREYLSDAYTHPVFKGGEVDEEDFDAPIAKRHDRALVPTKRTSRKNTPAQSQCNESQPHPRDERIL